MRGCLTDPDFSRVIQHSIQRIKMAREEEEEEEERGGDEDHDEDDDGDSDDGDGDTAQL